MIPQRTLTVGNETRTVVEWARLNNLSMKCIDYRIKAKWPPEEIVGLRPHDRKIGHIKRAKPVNQLTEFSPVPMVRREVIMTEVDHVAIGEQVKSCRLTAGKPLWHVANELKISEGYLSTLERGKARWNSSLLSRFNKLAATWVLEVSQ